MSAIKVRQEPIHPVVVHLSQHPSVREWGRAAGTQTYSVGECKVVLPQPNGACQLCCPCIEYLVGRDLGQQLEYPPVSRTVTPEYVPDRDVVVAAVNEPTGVGVL